MSPSQPRGEPMHPHAAGKRPWSLLEERIPFALVVRSGMGRPLRVVREQRPDSIHRTTAIHHGLVCRRGYVGRASMMLIRARVGMIWVTVNPAVVSSARYCDSVRSAPRPSTNMLRL